MQFSEGRLVAALVRMADTLVSDFDIFDLFYELVSSSTAVLGVAECGLLLNDGTGALRVAAATSEAKPIFELLELENAGGPGLESFRTGLQVQSGALTESAAKSRWPEFAAAAQTAGFHAVVAVPMHLRDQVLGALELFLTNDDDLTAADLAAAQALADLATIAILQTRSTVDDRTVISQLRTAFDTRVVIEQAKGIVAQRGLSMDEAFGRIRQYARNNNKRLVDVSAALVSGELTPPQVRSGG